jgi:hypothetical protein
MRPRRDRQFDRPSAISFAGRLHRRVGGGPALIGFRASAGVAEDPWRGGTMRQLENRFIACAVRNGVDADIARRVWGELARFGSYAFCKAHASGYGVLAYQTTYLKAHHAGAFYAALLNNHQGMYPTRVHVGRDATAWLAPCVHRSGAGWTWDGGRQCRTGQVKGLSPRSMRPCRVRPRPSPMLTTSPPDQHRRDDVPAPLRRARRRRPGAAPAPPVAGTVPGARGASHE